MSNLEKKRYYISLIDLMIGLTEEEREYYQDLSAEKVEEKYRMIYLEMNDDLISSSEVKSL